MMIHEITAMAGRYKARKRIGRGRGSGHGKTSGRGHNGAGSRAGHSKKLAFEGGQMPYFRRLPKRGFTNANFRVHFRVVNLREILENPTFSKGGEVNRQTLSDAGLIRDLSVPVKILGDLGEGGSLGVKLDITVARVSDSARKLVLDAGGKIDEQGTRRDRVRGVDRNSDDRTPKNLTKKLKQRGRGAKKRD